jgi:hypothetical protein
MTLKKNSTKSPIKHGPLRQAGESLREEQDRLMIDKALLWVIAPIFFCILALLEWYRWWSNSPPSPILLTVMAIITIIIAIYKLRKILPQALSIGLGIKGEKAVGECLERLREIGYRVFHDIPGDGFNVDHVLVGPGGIFVIETKTRMKPAKGESSVVYDGSRVTVNGSTPDRDPVVQVKASAGYIQDLVRRMTGKDIRPRPVLLFPGWYIKQASTIDIWVLNEKAFPQWVENADVVLDTDAIHHICAGLEMHIRNAN